jgi:hypothetical protein
MRYEGGTMGDFAIYVLGEDIGDFKPVKLGTLEIQKELEAERAFVEITGYGEYRDRCKDGDQLPCSAEQPATSQEPRKLKVQVRQYDDFLGLVGYERPQMKGNLLTWGGGKISPCGGDSGGSVTTRYKGEEIYLSVTPNGMNGYSCGAAGYYDGRGGIGYASPIQDHLDILQGLGLPVSYKRSSWPVLLANMSLDKKARGKSLRFVTITAIGKTDRLENPDDNLLFTAYEKVSL